MSDDDDFTLGEVVSGMDEMWQLVAAMMVFLMQAGFAMLEAGHATNNNSLNIMFKNVCNACISAFAFWLIGYGFAFGESKNGFIGTKGFALSDDAFVFNDDQEVGNLNYQTWFFQWAFLCTAATIVYGSVSGRTKIDAYFIYTFALSVFIYPIIVCWCWGDGWLSPFPEGKYSDGDFIIGGKRSNNYIDFAGSGVVHLVGGIAGLIGAIVVGPRLGRFNEDGTVNQLKGEDKFMTLLGTLILWIGWYGFNAGSTLCVYGSCAKIASKVAVNTTLGAASSGMTMILYQKIFQEKYSLDNVGKAILAGLVSITASCAVVDPWACLVQGIIGCIVYILASRALLHFQIDDPLDAAPIHGACGMWGVIAVGIFGTDTNASAVGYYASNNQEEPFTSGRQFAVQLVGLICITAWTVVTCSILFYGIDKAIGMRISQEEELGVDLSELEAHDAGYDENEQDKSLENQA
jgi:Amt family ammonium transporter